MDNVTFFTDEENFEQVVIDHGDGSFISMLKTEYDRRQAEQSTPIVAAE
jgi:hypothetical protein